jgi:4-amino-4-deoxy-L-arabinose transferase-like glycosyltransferase
LEKKYIIISLILITIISIVLKLYPVDFSTYVTSDAMSYSLNAFSFVNGDFTPIFNKSPGWPLLISPFFNLIESDDFVVYSNIVRILSITISAATIIPIYFLARKWFSEKYSLVAVSFFAFEPHLNYLAGIGYSESLYILIIVTAFYFVSSERYRYVCLAFLFAGIAWWVRWPGAIMFLVVSAIFLINFRKTKHSFLKYLGCLVIFVLIVSPILLSRYETFGDPLYFGITQGIYSGDYATAQGNMINKFDDYTATDYINDNGIFDFFVKFILGGAGNIILQLAKNSFPYLMILVPIGAIISFKQFQINKKFVRANWILIIVTLIPITTTYAVVPDVRFLLPLIPFLILFAVIPIQKIIENGLVGRIFSAKQKRIILISIIVVVLVLSFVYMQRYDVTSDIEEEEKNNFAQYAYDNFEGKMLDAGGTTGGIRFLKLNDPNEAFKSYLNSNHNYPKEIILDEGYLVPLKSNDNLILVGIYAKTFDEFLKIANDYDVNYISIGEKRMAEVIYPYFKNLYVNESEYTNLEKVFDSDEEGYKEFKVKVFEINPKGNK